MIFWKKSKRSSDSEGQIIKKLDEMMDFLQNKATITRRQKIALFVAAFSAAAAGLKDFSSFYSWLEKQFQEPISIAFKSVFSPTRTEGEGEELPGFIPGGIDVAIKNSSDKQFIFVRGRIFYEDYAHLPACVWGSFIPVEKCYQVPLELEPEIGLKQEFPLCHKVSGDDTARLRIAFTLREEDRKEIGEGIVSGYRLRLEIIDDEGNVLDCGRFVVFTPNDKMGLQLWPGKDRKEFTEGWAGGRAEEVDRALQCFSMNDSTFFRVTGVTDRLSNVTRSANIQMTIETMQNNTISHDEWWRNIQDEQTEGSDICSDDSNCSG